MTYLLFTDGKSCFKDGFTKILFRQYRSEYRPTSQLGVGRSQLNDGTQYGNDYQQYDYQGVSE
jgi:hypothetical protein